MNSADNNMVSFSSILTQVQEAKKAAKAKQIVRTFYTMSGTGMILDFTSCKL